MIKHPVYIEPTLLKANESLFDEEKKLEMPVKVCMSDIFNWFSSSAIDYLQTSENSGILMFSRHTMEVSAYNSAMGLGAGPISIGGVPPGKPKYVIIEGPAGAGKRPLCGILARNGQKGIFFTTWTF